MTKLTHQQIEEPEERALLVFVNEQEEDDDFVEGELIGLCEAAHVVPVGDIRQRISKPVKSTFVGKGKVQEIAAAAKELDADLVLVDEELSGIQTRNLQDACEVRVVDRTQLILDIFARRAKTKEGMLQVELAQLTYMLPKLMSVYTKFERQKGGIGMRGPGETKLETDRRMVRDRIAKLKLDIDEVRKHRAQQRESRRKHPFPFVSIVGYTSAGKSTLMNWLATENLLADAMPFATLDPTTRKIDLEEGYSFFVTDTVGFISRLPTKLIAAFQATLEEVAYADFLVHVVDISHPQWQVQHDAVMETLAELGADQRPLITVFNKVDKLEDPAEIEPFLLEWPGSIAISATEGIGTVDLVDKIIEQLDTLLSSVSALIPYSESGLVQECYDFGRVHKVEFLEEGILLKVDLVESMRHKLSPYVR